MFLIINNSYRLTFFSGVFDSIRMLVGALQALYLLNAGVTIGELAMLKAYFSFVVLIADVPLGMAGDFFGNKLCVYYACILVSAYYIFSLFAPKIIFLLLAESCYALGLCLLSGSLDALIIMAIKNEYSKPEMISYFYFLVGEITAIGSMITAILGTLIYEISNNMKYIYIISAALILLSIFLLVPVKEIRVLDKAHIFTFNYQFIKNILFNKIHIVYMTISGFIVIAYQPIYHFWQPFFIYLIDENKVSYLKFSPEKNTACYLVAIFFIYSLFNFIFNKLLRDHFTTKKNVKIWAISLATLLLIDILFIIVMPNRLIIFIIFIFGILHGLMTAFSNLTKSIISDKLIKTQIATVVSLSNVIGRVLSTIFLLLCSFVLGNEVNSIIFMMTFFSVAMIILIFLKSYKYIV